MKRIRVICLAGAATLVVAASAYAIPSVTFKEGGGLVEITSSGFSTVVFSIPSAEGALFGGYDPTPLPGTQTAVGSILYWEDAEHTILSDYVSIQLQGSAVPTVTPTAWYVTFASDEGGALTPPGFPILANVTETAGLMETTVTLTTQNGTQMSILIGVQSDVEVPDGGLTAMLLGMGLMGLGWVRRMLK